MHRKFSPEGQNFLCRDGREPDAREDASCGQSVADVARVCWPQGSRPPRATHDRGHDPADRAPAPRAEGHREEGTGVRPRAAGPREGLTLEARTCRWP